MKIFKEFLSSKCYTMFPEDWCYFITINYLNIYVYGTRSTCKDKHLVFY